VIDVTVTTTWQGKVAVRGQYIREAERTGQDIMIYHDHGSMRIPNHKLYELLVGKSDSKVLDRYGKQEPDYLYYFYWQPDVVQGVLV